MLTSRTEIYKQHQAEIAYDAANPSRMFGGVQDDPTQRGELFGVVSECALPNDNQSTHLSSS